MSEPALLSREDVPWPIRVVRKRCRNFVLRVHAAEGIVTLTLPGRASLSAGLEFLSSRRPWLQRIIARAPAAMPFRDGALIPFAGGTLRLCAAPGTRGLARLEGDRLLVPGAPEHFARRVRDWLKAEARRRLWPAAAAHAAGLGKSLKAVGVRDTSSRWGSCARDGRMSFCWRLVLAPDFVLDHVAAHEAAHLVHFDHGPGFHALLDRLSPRRAEAEAYLRREGPGLMAVGQERASLDARHSLASKPA